MPKKTAPPKETEESALVAAAKVVGAAAGKVAALAGVSTDSKPATKSTKVGKLVKKDKQRLPRRQKKAAQKKNASHPS